MVAYLRKKNEGQTPNPLLTRGYNQFIAFKRLVMDKAANNNTVQQLSMDQVEQHLGAQPHRINRGVASCEHHDELFSSPAPSSAGAASALGRNAPNPAYGRTFPTPNRPGVSTGASPAGAISDRAAVVDMTGSLITAASSGFTGRHPVA